MKKTIDFKIPENKRKYNEELFSIVAPKYNFVTRVLSFGCDHYWKKQLIKNLPSGKKCLDVACGTGDIAWMLSDVNQEVIGIDLTLEMLKRVKKKKNIKFLQQDMCNLNFDDNSFDVITGGYALRNAPDLNIALNEVYRVLRPGGTASFLDFSKYKNTFLQKIQYSALMFWCGLWGILLHCNPAIYTYIPKSLQQYPDTIELKNIFKNIGFCKIESKKFFFGFTEIITCKK